MAPYVCGEKDSLSRSVRGKSSPSEILKVLSPFNVEAHPIWKHMHMQERSIAA